MCCGDLIAKSHPTLVTPWTDPTKLLCSWDFPSKNIGVGCHFLLQGIFLTQELNSGLLHCRQVLYWLSCELYSLACYMPRILTFGGSESPGEFENTKSRLLPSSMSLSLCAWLASRGFQYWVWEPLYYSIVITKTYPIWMGMTEVRGDVLAQTISPTFEREGGSSDYQDWEAG